MRQIMSKYEDPGFDDKNEAQAKEIVELMQQVSALVFERKKKKKKKTTWMAFNVARESGIKSNRSREFNPY